MKRYVQKRKVFVFEAGGYNYLFSKALLWLGKKKFRVIKCENNGKIIWEKIIERETSRLRKEAKNHQEELIRAYGNEL